MTFADMARWSLLGALVSAGFGLACNGSVAELETFALDYVTCEGSLPGLHALKPGEVLEIADAGARFSGEYYLTRVTHIYESGSYSTDIVGKRRST